MLKKILISTLAVSLFVLAGCAPARPVAEPGGKAGPVDESAVLGVWTYEISGSCYLLRGNFYITRGQSGLSGRLTENPYPATVDPNSLELQKDRKRCPRRATPFTLTLNDLTFDGETLVFSGSSSDQLTAPFTLIGRATVEDEQMRGTLSISGGLGNVGRSEAASIKATRVSGEGGQSNQTDTTKR